MAGTNKPFVMSSGTGVVGETGPEPVTEEFPIDPEHALAARVSTERVGRSSLRPFCSVKLNLQMHTHLAGGHLVCGQVPEGTSGVCLLRLLGLEVRL